MTMIGEEAFEVYLKGTVFGFFKTDGFNEAFDLFIFDLTHERSVMDTAEIDEIESASAEHEERFEVEDVFNGSKIIYEAAFIRELELTNAAKLVVDGSGISKQIGIVGYAATKADILLRNF